MNKELTLELPAVIATGQFQCFVIDAKTKRTIKEYPPQRNLILDSGLDALDTRSWKTLIEYCACGTGTTPTKDIIDGTASQSGNTVTLSGSTWTATSGDIGKWIKFATGEEAKITAAPTGVTWTVNKPQTVAAAVCCLYRANQTGLVSESKRTTAVNSTFLPEYDDGARSQATISNTAAETVMLRRTYDQTAETSSVNYTEVGVSWAGTAGANLFSRVLLSGAVTVEDGQQLRIRYELTLKLSYVSSRPTQTLPITGWPYPYTITGIVSTGSNFTVTVSAAHHLLAAGKLTLSGVKRPRTAITAASSNSTTMTLTTGTAHGKAPGDTIIVEGMTPLGYNGEWVCDTGTTGSTVIITNIANPGTGTVFGNLRLKEPTTWYDGEWTIASVTSTTIVVTSALNLGAAGEGIAANNLKATPFLSIWSMGFQSGYAAPQTPDAATNYVNNTSSPSSTGLHDGEASGSNIKAFLLYHATTTPTPPTFPQTSGWSAAGTGRTFSAGIAGVKVTYVNGNFYQDNRVTWNTGNGNSQTIRGILFQNIGTASTTYIGAGWLFDEPQRKDSTHQLNIYIRKSWGRTLPVP